MDNINIKETESGGFQMKNVKVIFTDADYELVTKAYEQYNKLEKDYYDKYALFGVSTLVILLIGPLMFTFAQCISNTIFAGLIIIACTIVLFIFFLRQTLAYEKKIDIVNKYKTDCFNIKCNIADFIIHSNKVRFDTSSGNKLFYKIITPDPYKCDISCSISLANEIPYADNIVLQLKEITDKHGYVSYVWQAESEEF